MRKLLVVTFLTVAWSIITILALTWGVLYNWPDYVHTDYGFPLTWATHTTDTFVGPVNQWTVNLTALAEDLVIWLGIMVVANAIIQIVLNRKKQQN
jgi:hypothetical protein